jgi:Secretion system C-terminal sorting domain
MKLVKLCLFLIFCSLQSFSQSTISCNICENSTGVCNPLAFNLPTGTYTFSTTEIANAIYSWSVTGTGLIINGSRTNATVSITVTATSLGNKICLSKSVNGSEPCCTCIPFGTPSPCVLSMKPNTVICQYPVLGGTCTGMNTLLSFDAKIVNPFTHSATAQAIGTSNGNFCDAGGPITNLLPYDPTCTPKTVPFQYYSYFFAIPPSGFSQLVTVKLTDQVTGATFSGVIKLFFTSCSGGAFKPDLGKNNQLEEFNEKLPIEVSPNPSNSTSIISYYSKKIESGSYLEIINSSGIKIKQYKLISSSGKFEVNTADLKDGIYLISCNFGNGKVYTNKLVVKH